MLTKTTNCIHCYCGNINTNGIPHKVCCNCANKQARMNDQTWNPATTIVNDRWYWDQWPNGAIKITD